MPLHDTEGYIVEGGTAAESLPDPTTVNGRTHLLVNTGTVTAVWSSVGATPFQQGGVNVATVSLARGQALQVQSDGTRWVAKSSGMRQMASGSGVTVAGGQLVIVFPVPFAVTPNLVAQVQAAGGSNAPFDIRITAISTTGATLEVRSAAAVSVALIGLTVLLGTTVSVGTTVHWIATVPGATP